MLQRRGRERGVHGPLHDRTPGRAKSGRGDADRDADEVHCEKHDDDRAEHRPAVPAHQFAATPEALAFTAMFAALPGSPVAATFSLIVLGVIATQIGALQTAPVRMAVITASLAVSGSGLLMALAQRQRKTAASDA